MQLALQPAGLKKQTDIVAQSLQQRDHALFRFTGVRPQELDDTKNMITTGQRDTQGTMQAQFTNDIIRFIAATSCNDRRKNQAFLLHNQKWNGVLLAERTGFETSFQSLYALR